MTCLKIGFLITSAILPVLNASVYLSPRGLSFTYQQGGAVPTPVNVTITGSGNFTVQVSTNPSGWLEVSPTSGSVPAVLQVRSLPGGLAAANYSGLITVRDANPSCSYSCTDTVYVNLSVSGGTPPPTSPSLFRFAAVQPCRVVDTRVGEGKTGPFGPPSLDGGQTRQIPIPAGNCGIPADARAYSVNVTVVPVGPLGYLTLWPTGQTQPLVSTLNSFEGRIVANAAVVPAGTNGSINVFVTNRTDVIIDINGYFVP